MKTRVLITGHQGYLGSVMVNHVLEAGYDVIGLDTGYYAECTLVPDRADIPTMAKDIRDLTPHDVEGCSAVIHLAALSNDPLGNLNPAWTEEINFRASVRLAELAKAAGVERFLFSSSCIMYGMSEAVVVTEESPLTPQTAYARSKVESERAMVELADEHFSPTFLRNGTIYGLSPRMRFDTVLNNLMASAVTTGKVVLHGDGTPWRPVAHAQDISRAFVRVLQAPRHLVHNQAFNNGANHMNYSIIELARMVVRTVPGCSLECLASPEADQRTYKTDFGKFARTFPDFAFTWTVPDGIAELHEVFKAVRVTQADFADPRFTRLKWLRYLVDSGRVDESLRWTAVGAAQR